MAYDWRPTASRSVTTDAPVVVRPSPALTTAAAIEEFIEAAEQGRAVNRSGRSYRPSALRDLTGILRYHVVPQLGDRPLREIRRSDVQTLVNGLAGEGLSESRIRSVISALRALYGYAIEKGYADFNPADGLVMPRGEDVPNLEDPPRWEDPPGRRLLDRWRPADGTRTARKAPKPNDRDRSGYEPMAVMPDRILSLALRAVFVLFIVVALISLVQPA
jgi:hypothetical protein